MTPHVDKACMRRVRPCKMRSARHSEPVLLLQDITVEIKNLLLRGSAYNIALGQSKLRIDAQFAAQPGRQKALALLMDRTHVDIVMATRSSSGEVTWQHTGALPFSIDKDSPGFVALLAALTASSAGTGRQEYDPPAHQLRDYRYTGTKQALKYLASGELAGADQSAVRSPSTLGVWHTQIVRTVGPSVPEAAILKIGPTAFVESEVCSPGVLITALKSHIERTKTHLVCICLLITPPSSRVAWL